MVVTLAAFHRRLGDGRDAPSLVVGAAQYRQVFPHPEARLDAGAGAQPRRTAAIAGLTVLHREAPARQLVASNATSHGLAALPAGALPARAGALAARLRHIRDLFWRVGPLGASPPLSAWARRSAMRRRADVASWAIAGAGATPRPWRRAVFSDITSVMDFGIVPRPPGDRARRQVRAELEGAPASLLAAVIGGLMLGYGAASPMACNIGALFQKASLRSLHGWVWWWRPSRQHHRHAPAPVFGLLRSRLEANGC